MLRNVTLPTLQALQALSSPFSCLMFLWVARTQGSIRQMTLLLLTLLGILGRLFSVGRHIISGLVFSMWGPEATALAVATLIPVVPILVVV